MKASEFNRLYPVGTRVTAYPGARPELTPDAKRVETTTRTPAQTFHGKPVVMVHNCGSWIALTHVDPAQPAEAYTPPAHYVRTDGTKTCVHTIPVNSGSCPDCWDLVKWDHVERTAPTPGGEQAEAVLAWEAVYDSATFTAHLIGYLTDEMTAKRAAEAWFRANRETENNTDWIADPQLATGEWDVWDTLVEVGEEGRFICGTDIVVRHRATAPVPAAGRDDTSTAETDFFQPGHGYTHRDGSDFLTVAVTTHPVTREPRAFGWIIRNGWHEGAALDPDDWTQYDGCEPPTPADGYAGTRGEPGPVNQ